MALDKVVDSAVLDAGLTATANAIREKTGDAAVIQWMNENGFKAAVEAIEAGGNDLPDGLLYGSYTPAEDTKTFSIPGYNNETFEVFTMFSPTKFSNISSEDSGVKSSVGSRTYRGDFVSLGINTQGSANIGFRFDNGVVIFTHPLVAGKQYLWFGVEVIT